MHKTNAHGFVEPAHHKLLLPLPFFIWHPSFLLTRLPLSPLHYHHHPPPDAQGCLKAAQHKLLLLLLCYFTAVFTTTSTHRAA